MPRRLKSDVATLHDNIARIIAREIKTITDRQKELHREGKGLSLDEFRLLKIAIDSLNDTAKTKRILEQDVRKVIESMAKEQLEALAAGKPDPKADINPSHNNPDDDDKGDA